jgi:putative transposase
VRQDGIHFETMRYLDLTLAAYVGEWVTIRYDPQDMAEIRVYHHDRFLCRAVCQELAGETISLKELVKVRDARRRELRATLTDRAALLDQLLATSQHPPADPIPEQPASAPPRPMRLKRYINE